MRLSGALDSYGNHKWEADEADASGDLTPMYKFFDPKLNGYFAGGIAKPMQQILFLSLGHQV